MRRIQSRLALAALAIVVFSGTRLSAQTFRAGGTEFLAMRSVDLPADKAYSIAVVEFYHHGLINAEGTNVVAMTKGKELVPVRVLQLGPGDFCRLAIQTATGQKSYDLLYGGKPPSAALPPWTAQDGLLLETREYKNSLLDTAEHLREAFDQAKPIGAGYVDAVHHSSNPFSPKPEPFFSRYSGSLHIPTAGTYGFLTSSRDASFLLIDGKTVVSGQGIMHQAKPGSRKDTQLSAGPHKFEYLHVAAGPEAMMVAAWEVSPPAEKPAPTAIPGEVFRTGSVGPATVGPPVAEGAKPLPDFAFRITGDVPLPDDPEPLIGVLFQDTSPSNLSLKAKIAWDFGDGQTAEGPQMNHVYLRPGLYTVRLSPKRTGRDVEIAHRIEIDRPLLTAKDEKTFHKLDDYLPVLQTYDPKTLDAASLRQLVLAYQAKAEAMIALADEERLRVAAEAPAQEASEEKPPAPVKKPPRDRRVRDEDDPTQPKHYIMAAVTAGKTPFVEETAAQGDEALFALARLVAPMARDQLGDAKLAGQIWFGAAKKIQAGPLKAHCEIEAADVAVNDLVNAPAAKRLLDAAAGRLVGSKTGETARRLQQVLGDYWAATGDGAAARKAYAEAQQIGGAARRYIEQTAWRGARSRSTEEFIREEQFDRAASELRAWQNEFPSEKTDGYLTLLYARYWAGRELYDQAIAQAEQLQAVNADSPYVDQLLLLAAECEVKRGKTDRAIATLHSLLTNYPGSPLVPEAKQRLLELEGTETKQP